MHGGIENFYMRSIMNGRWAALEGCKSMAELYLVSGLLYHLRQKKKEFHVGQCANEVRRQKQAVDWK